LPGWLSFDRESRAFSGIPGVQDVGALLIEVQATDTSLAMAANQFILTVNAIPDQILEGGAENDALIGNKGNDVLNGRAGNDVLAGEGGNDILLGGSGADTYLINTGSGVDHIADPSLPGQENTLVFGDGIGPGDITLGIGSLVLRIGQTGNEVHLDSFDPDQPFGVRDIDWFRFADGTRLSYEQLLSRQIEIFGTDGADTLEGTALNDAISAGPGNDVLHGGGGNDFLTGGTGNDVYRFGPGDGTDVILDAGVPGEANRLVFEPGIGAEELTVDLVDGDLIVGAGADRVAIRGFAAGSSGIERFELPDGTTFTRASIMELVNRPPQPGLAMPPQTAVEDAFFSFGLPANVLVDPDTGDEVTYSVTRSDGGPLPNWLSFDSATRTFSGTPSNMDVGNAAIRVTATDTGALSASNGFELTVINTNDAPIAGNDSFSVNEDQVVEIARQALVDNDFDVDPTDDILTIVSVQDGQHGSVSLDENEKASFTPDADYHGPASFTYTVVDGKGGSATATVNLTVTPENDAPRVGIAIGSHTATEDSSYTFQLLFDAFADVDNDSLGYAFSLADGSPLPGWLAFNGVRTITGTPRNEDVGAIEIKVTASDGLQSISQQFALAVQNTNDAPFVSSPVADRTTVERQAFAFAVPATTFADLDGGDTLTYAASGVTGAALPAWLRFDSATRILSGTPAEYDIGTIAVALTAFDSAGTRAVEEFNLTVTPLPGTTLTGTSGSDMLVGGPGADTLYGLGGNDTLYGNQGVDVLYGGAGSDQIYGWTGNDTLYGGNGNDRLHGDEGNDTLFGEAGADTLWGWSGHDVLYGGDGTDTLGGDEGDDALFGQGDADSLYGWAGNDYLSGGSGNDQLLGEEGNDVVQGEDGIDRLYGHAGNDLLQGGAGNDTLDGGVGSDLFIAGTGSDTLSPNAGADVIAFNRGDGQDAINASAGADNTLSLGGGISYSNLTFSRNSSNLVLNVGTTEKITFVDWYTATANRSVLNLQVIAEAMASFNSGGSDPLFDNKVERFDFQKLAAAFDTAGQPSNWALTDALLDAHLAGSDTEAIGGDLAYRYGLQGNLTGVGFIPAQEVLSAPSFGLGAHLLRPLDQLLQGQTRLA
jgi:Ca2+-binding RTX toxin-like protein